MAQRAFLFTLWVLILSFPMTTEAQRRARFNKGDRVRAEFLGREVEGTVVGYDSFGDVEVEITFRGRKLVRDFEPIEIELVRPKVAKPSPRKWQARAGSFTTNATLVGRDETYVELKKSAGKVTRVPISKLSDTDHKYLEKYPIEYFEARDADDEDDDFGRGGEVRDRIRRMRSRLDRRRDEDQDRGDLIDLTKAREILLVGSKKWQVKPDPAATASLTQWERVSTGPRDFHDKVGFAVAENAPAAAMSVHNAFEDGTEIHVFNLSNGKTLATQSLDPELTVIAVSPDGRRVVAIGGRSFKSSFYVFSFNKEGLSEPKQWRLENMPMSTHLMTATFISNRELIVANPGVLAWNVDTGKATMKCQSAKTLSISAGGRYMAIPDGEHVHIFDIQEHRIAGSIDCPSAAAKSFAFNAEGTSLAGYSDGQVLIWDLASGGQTSEVWLTTATTDRSIRWTGVRHVLLGGKFLVDTRLGLPVWLFSSDRSTKMMGTRSGKLLYTTGDEKSGAIVPLHIPQPELLQACEDLDGQTVELLAPSPIALDINLSMSGSNDVRDHFRDSLTKLGYQIDDSSELKLTARVETEKRETHKVRDRFDHSAPWVKAKSDTTIHFTPTVSYLEYKRGDKVVFSRQRRNDVPHMLFLNENETPQQAANRYCIPDADFFLGFNVPKTLRGLPNDKKLLGSSKLTARGIQ